MDATLYTVHRKGARGLRVVPDRFDWLGMLLPPVWIVWHGLWITGVGLVLVVLAAAFITPFAVLVVLSGAGLIFALEGGSVIRAELSVRRWREVAVVEARSPAGAEELWLTGQAA